MCENAHAHTQMCVRIGWGTLVEENTKRHIPMNVINRTSYFETYAKNNSTIAVGLHGL